MICDWQRVTGPTREPLALDEAKAHAIVHQNDDNALLSAYLTAAREQAEQYLNRALFTQTWTLQLSGFPEVVWLPMAAPLQSVSTVQYYDAAGDLQTLSSSAYVVDTVSEPGRLSRAPQQSWPAVQADRLAVVFITYVCGWASEGAIPELIKQGIRLCLAGMDGDRIGESDLTAARRCWDLAGRVHWRPPQC